MMKRTCCRIAWTVAASLWLAGAASFAQEPLTQEPATQEAGSLKPPAEEPAPLGTAPAAPQAAAPAEDGMPEIVHDPNLADVAWEYLDAMLLGRLDQAAKFLTPESHYQDFSMEFFGRERIDLKGGPAILKFWKEAAESSGIIEVRFDADQYFVAGPNVYFIGTAFVTNEGRAWGVNMQTMDFTFTQISHIRMVDGKVTYHADHADYATALEQLETYREEAGPWRPEGDKEKK